MRKVQLGKLLLIAAVVEGIGLIANAVTSFATVKAAGALRWAVPPAVALVAAMAKALVDAVNQDKTPVPDTGATAPPPIGPTWRGYPPGGYPPTPTAQPASGSGSGGPRARGRGRTTAFVAVLVILLVCGVGGVAVTAATRYVVGWVTGTESGTDRLVQPASGRAGSLTLTVESVVYTTHFTRVELTARNSGQESVGLPVYGNCVLTGSEGTVLEADPFRSKWSDTVPPGGVHRGTVTFGGKLPDSVTRASLSFSNVFALGGGAITVAGLELRTG